MQVRKEAIVFLVALLLCVNIASSQPFTVTDFAVSNKVTPGATALYTVTVYNNQTRLDTFEIKADPLSVFPFNDYFENIVATPSSITIGSRQSSSVNVSLTMRTKIEHNKFYSNYITVRSKNSGSAEQHRLAVKIIAPETIVSIQPKMPSAVPPGGKLEFDVKFINNINQQLSNVELIISSDLFEDKKEIMLFPFQERTETFSYDVKFTEPKEYPLSIRIYYKGQLSGKAATSFSVSEKADLKEKTETASEFLKRTITATKVNMGNTIIEDSYDLKLNWFAKMFTQTNIEPKSVEGSVYHWVLAINPGQKIEVTAITNYRPLFIAFLVIVLFGIILYFILTRSVTVHKEIIKVRQTPEKTSEYKILLHIKNKTRKPIQNLSIIELLPHMVKPVMQFGTLKPENIQKGEPGIRMMWKIDELLKGEERIISYRIETNLGIVGEYSLPPALLRYKNVKNRTVNAKSNKVRFF